MRATFVQFLVLLLLLIRDIAVDSADDISAGIRDHLLFDQMVLRLLLVTVHVMFAALWFCQVRIVLVNEIGGCCNTIFVGI